MPGRRVVGLIAFPIIIGFGALIQSLGWLVGAAVGGLTWTIGLIWGAHRLLPERRRGVPVVLAVVLAVAGSAIGIVALGASDGGRPPLTADAQPDGTRRLAEWMSGG